jgi:YD repeat-containing protein
MLKRINFKFWIFFLFLSLLINFPLKAKNNISISREKQREIIDSLSKPKKKTNIAEVKNMGWQQEIIPQAQLKGETIQPVISEELQNLEQKRKKRKDKFKDDLEKKEERKELITFSPRNSKRSGLSITNDDILSQPRIAVAPQYVIFNAIAGEANTLKQVFKITNGGIGTLNFTLSETSSWFDLNKSSGVVTTGEDEVLVTVNTSGLSTANSPYMTDIVITNTVFPNDKKRVRVCAYILEKEAYTKTFSYDTNGNLVRKIMPNSDIINYTYDKLNRLTDIFYPNGDVVSYIFTGNRRTQYICILFYY